jgi:hypothetical protein
MRKLTVLSMVIALAFTAMPAATAHNTDPLRGSFEGGSMPVFDPEAVAARCPEGFQWILKTSGSGQLTTDVYTGGFTYTGEHCSRWMTGPPDRADRRFVGRVGDGVMTLTTPDGDLVVSYAGTFVFRGDVTIPNFTSKVRMRYRVDGDKSTNVFEGASGRGPLFVEEHNGYQTGRLFGSIALDD